jgi:hypothetical protein
MQQLYLHVALLQSSNIQGVSWIVYIAVGDNFLGYVINNIPINVGPVLSCKYFFLNLLFMEYVITLRHLGQLTAGDAHKYQAYLCTHNRTIDNRTAVIAYLFEAQVSLNFRKFHYGDWNLEFRFIRQCVTVLSHIFKVILTFYSKYVGIYVSSCRKSVTVQIGQVFTNFPFLFEHKDLGNLLQLCPHQTPCIGDNCSCAGQRSSVFPQIL